MIQILKCTHKDLSLVKDFESASQLLYLSYKLKAGNKVYQHTICECKIDTLDKRDQEYFYLLNSLKG